MINVEENWNEFLTELKKVNRDGVDKLIKYLSKTDFKTAPASTAFHLNEKGGLILHSLHVLRFLREEVKSLEFDVTDETMIICGLLHDLCKANFYVEAEVWDKEWKDKTNQWRKKKVWQVADQIPLGHGEKSVIMANRFIQLTMSEMAAIRWHMTGFDPGIHFNYPSGFPYREAMDKYPLCKFLAISDQKAELYESLQKEEECSPTEPNEEQ